MTLHGWYEDDDNVFLAMEYFQYGDLDAYIDAGISEDGAKLICAQLLDGLSLMHRMGFTHRDLKPQVGPTLKRCPLNKLPFLTPHYHYCRTFLLRLLALIGASKLVILGFQRG